MSGKRGRKCSMKHCESYQHTHKHLSFFRFPKDPVRCKVWIEKSERPDLLEKVNVHEERVCERHFEPSMFLNEYRNRLHQSAVPVLCLTNEPQQLPTFVSTSHLSHPNEHKMANFRKSDLQHANNLYKAQLNNVNVNKGNQSKFTGSNISSQLQQSKQAISSSSTTAAAMSASPTTVATSLNPGYKRPRQIFTLEQEEQLAVYVRDTANYYSGLSSKEVRILAFVYGVCNQVDMPVGWRETHQASFDWCLGFIKRNKLSPMILTGHTYKSLNNSNSTSVKSNSSDIQQAQNLSASQVSANANGNSTPIEIDG